MLSKKLSLLSIVLVLAGTLQSNAQKANYTASWEVKNPFTHNVFIENKGQFPATLEDAVKQPILYYSVKGSMYLFFSQNSVTFLNSKLQKKDDNGDEKGGDRDKELVSVPELMSITWDGANSNPEVTVENESADYYTYSIPHDKSGMGTITAHGWSKLTYHNLYNGIDVVFYYPNKGGLEYDIIVHPGADPSIVKMNYTGAKPLLKAGNIYLSSFSEFTDHAPTTKDENGNNITSTYTLNNNSVSFRVGNYDRSKTITIDPWVTTTSFTTTNSAYDIGYDVYGNVYAYGGGATTDYQLQKYNGSGVLQWTYTTTFPVFGLSAHAYGDLVTDTRTGVSYVMASEEPTGCPIISISPTGAVIHTYPGTSSVSELWRIDLDYCHNLLIIGSGENGGPYQGETIDTALTTFTPVNVLNYDSSFHDMCLLALDQQGHAYMAQSEASGASTQNMFNNVFMQLPIPSLIPSAYFISDGYTFQEIGSIKYYPGGGFGPVVGNGMNGMAANKSMVVTYDGATVKKWTTTGTLKKSATTGGASFTQGGIDLDCQGHIYAGNGSTIAVYDSTLASLGTIAVANTVYDLKIAGNDMAYACGKTFVGAYKNTYISKMVTITATAPTACSACNGQATANVSCGSGTYTYKWSNGATTSTITGLCQGIYSVTVTDASTCAGAGREDTAMVKFIIAGGPTLSISSKTNALCNGGGGGSATVNATGGSPFTYSWSPSGGTNATATNLSEGTYTVTVTNSSGCISVDTVNISQPSQIQIGITIAPACSGNNGSATAIPSGGVGPYTYSWAPSGGTNATASGLGAGSYTVTVKDNNGCTQTQAVKVTTATGVGPTVTVNPITPASCSVCNGAASVTASGGTAPYTFNWSNGATTSAVSNLCGATYTVSVGSAGDTAIVPFYTEDFGTLGAGWTLNIAGSGTPGTHPNKWVVDNNTSLCNVGGNYLHVACSSTNTYYTCTAGAHYDPGNPVGDNSATDLYASSPNINTSGQSGMVISFTYQCEGNVSGTSSADYSLLSFSSNGGTTWNDQPTKYANTTTCTKVSVPIPAMYDGLTNFRYAFRWINKGKGGNGSDPGMCVDSISIGSKSFVTGCPTSQVINVPPNGSFSVSVTPTSASCGANNGSATVTPTPTGAYTYKWSNGQTTQTASNLASGSYTVIVSVSGGCADTTTVTINNSGGPSVSSITRTDVLCNGGNTGDATANVTGGATPYTYNWSSGQTTSSASNLPAGTYTCTVKDKNGCQTTDTVIITQPSPITAKVTGTTQANCGSTNGSATISASGGTGALKYSWSPSGGTSLTASGLGAGSYTCTITDANNCTQTVTASISNTGGATVSSTSKDPLCNGNKGSAIVVVTSGTGPYTYTWPVGTTSFDSSATNLAAGTYICAVTDKNGCITNDTIIITQPTALAGTPVVTNANCGASDGSAVMYATGGTGTYTYSWSGGQTTSSIINQPAGSYTCTITDGNGCTKPVSVLISNANAPTVSAVQTNEKCFGDNIGTATVTATGGSGSYTYSWSSGQTTSSISNVGAGTYTCTVTDGSGCKSFDTVKITQPTALASTITPTPAVCGTPGSAKVTPVGGTGPYSYSWSTAPVQTTNPATGLTAGNYTCTVTDANGCTQQLNTTITGSSGPVVTISADTIIKQGSSVTISATGGGTYAWSPSTGLGCSTCASTTADPTKSTTYCVLVTDIASGCSDSACMTINVEVPCGAVWVPNAFSPNGDNENDRECVYGGCLETLDFSIFDRWGNRVFHTTDPSQTCWDGIYNGKVMNTGVFVYYLDAVKTNGDKVTLKGNITLLR
jgi:gliding motility-associated-like protein